MKTVKRKRAIIIQAQIFGSNFVQVDHKDWRKLMRYLHRVGQDVNITPLKVQK